MKIEILDDESFEIVFGWLMYVMRMEMCMVLGMENKYLGVVLEMCDLNQFFVSELMFYIYFWRV